MYQPPTPALHLHTHLNERDKRENNAFAQATSGKGKKKAIESHTPSVTTTQTSLPTSVSATGSRSTHKEGKNYICLAGKTPLGMYLRRCKEVILNDRCVDVVSPYPYSF